MKKDERSLTSPMAEAAAGRKTPVPRRIEFLVPIDFSEPSVNALRQARDLAASEKAQLVLLNVVEEPRSFRTLNVVGQRRACCDQRAGRLRELADRELGSQATTCIQVREGKPAVEIARLAGQRGVELIVVGRHEHHGVLRWVQGHTASRVLKMAPCPVLLLKADGHHN